MCLVIAFGLSHLAAYAGVVVTQNLGPGATAWPATPIIKTLTNPSVEATVPESFSSCTSYGQTFTIPAGGNNYTLQTIYLYAGDGTGTSPSATVTLNLYDLGGQTAPNPNPYVAGQNKFGSGSGLSITYVPQSAGLLKLDFTSTDQVQLLNGHMYVFELQGISGTTPIQWYRAGADTYASGAAYRDRSWINGNNARDFALAVYGVINTDPIPGTSSTINASSIKQQIDGFGAGVVFMTKGTDPISTSDADKLFGTASGQLGLTLLRVRIAPTQTTSAWSNSLADAQKAYARGAKIVACPWSPPPEWKSNNNIVGGYLLPQNYGAYRDWLNVFAAYFATRAAPLAAISVQNEPDITVTYESCSWTPEQLRVFTRDYAGTITVPFMMPESFTYDLSISDPTLNDPAAAANVDFIGCHLYGSAVKNYPLALQMGTRIWMTEFLINDQTIGSAVSTGKQISDCLSVGNMSAYIWWKTLSNENGLLNNRGIIQKRGYVMAQFSRFVRPGDVRVDATNDGSLGVTAFKNPTTGAFEIVVANDSTLTVTHTFNLQGVTVTSLTPWVTSSTDSLAQKTPITVTNGSFTYTVAPTSVVTFVK